MDCASAVVGDLARPQNMSAALAGVDAVIHSAGLAHGMTGLPEDDYRMLNTEATIALARAAQRAGAKRFVFLSSIRAQCGASAEEVLTEALPPRPEDAYGRSKLAAEQGLAQLGIDWAALRLVLVYGPGVKGNMAQLLRLARSRYPLPFGALRARRSLLALDNLVAAVDAVLATPQRSRCADDPGNDHRDAQWPRPRSRPRPGADSLAGNIAARCGPHRDLSPARRLAGRGSRGTGTAGLDAPSRNRGGARGARAKLIARDPQKRHGRRSRPCHTIRERRAVSA
jgi:hypothetical protein